MEIPSHIKKFADKATANLLPVKSAGRYEAEYQKFVKWCEENKINEYSETTLLAYFQIKSEIAKASTWSTTYSILKTTLGIKHNVNNSNFHKLS
jgi:ribosome-associated toxin RatA of RatAB toxin-antitoxin module